MLCAIRYYTDAADNTDDAEWELRFNLSSLTLAEYPESDPISPVPWPEVRTGTRPSYAQCNELLADTPISWTYPGSP